MTDSGTNHEIFLREETVKTSTDRSFGIVFTVVFAIIGLWPLMGGHGVRLWAIAVAGVLLVVALVRPVWLAPANRLWTKFGLLLHHVTNPLIMGLVFFVVVTPMALGMRFLGKDPLCRKIDKSAKSYWIDREPPGPKPETMINQF